jgi:hypothetical protein
MYYETLRARNLQEMDRFHSKLVTFSLYKNTLVNKHTNYVVGRLWIRNVFIVLGLYYKTLRIRNLQEMDRLRSKLVTFS